jgi:hypothetical protein
VIPCLASQNHLSMFRLYDAMPRLGVSVHIITQTM